MARSVEYFDAVILSRKRRSTVAPSRAVAANRDETDKLDFILGESDDRCLQLAARYLIPATRQASGREFTLTGADAWKHIFTGRW